MAVVTRYFDITITYSDHSPTHFIVYCGINESDANVIDLADVELKFTGGAL